MKVGRDLVLNKLKETFPRESPEDLLAILDLYGAESYEPERERVQLAILKLCDGDVGALLSTVAMAKRDYRDVLAYAEYPGEMRLSAAEMGSMSAREAESIRDKDRRQYLEWLGAGE